MLQYDIELPYLLDCECTMHSLTPDYLANLRFDTDQLTTLRALGEYRGKQHFYVAQSPEVPEPTAAGRDGRIHGIVQSLRRRRRASFSIAEAKHTEAQTLCSAAWVALEYVQLGPIEEASA